MTNTLREFYDKLVMKPRSFEISYMEPCSYIKKITDCNNEHIIFIYNKRMKSNSLSVFKNDEEKFQNVQLNISDDDNNLTGTPLEDQCEIDLINLSLENKVIESKSWTDDEENFAPISLDEARDLLMEVTTYRENNIYSGTLWVLCQPNQEENTIIKHITLEPNRNTRGLVYFDGFTTFSNINIFNLMEKHFGYLQKRSQLSTQIDHCFTIHKCMTVKYSRETSSKNIVLRSLKGADITLFQNISLGDCESAAVWLWNRLIILDMINISIVKYERFKNAEFLEYGYGSGIEIEKLTDKMLQVLQNILPVDTEDKDVEEVNNFDHIVKAVERHNCLDTVDHMWTILQKCNSYDDLKLLFTQIFQWAANGVVINVPINENHLSKLIREISEKRIAIPILTGSQPLELLLEIGLEKASKDYERIFTKNRTCSAKDLFTPTDNKKQNAYTTNDRLTLANVPRKTMNPKMAKSVSTNDAAMEQVGGIQNSTYERSLVENKLAKLAQIHIILEHLLLIETKINLTSANQFVLNELRKPLKPFNIIKSSSVNYLNIDLTQNQIIENMEEREPTTLRINMSSETKFQDITNTFYFGAPIFPTSIYPCMQIEENNVEKDQNVYVALHYLKLSTKYG